MTTAFIIILGNECSSEVGFDSQKLKEIATDVESFGVACFTAICKIEPSRAPRQNARESLLARTNFAELTVGELSAPAGPPSRSPGATLEIDRRKLLRLLDRQ